MYVCVGNLDSFYYHPPFFSSHKFSNVSTFSDSRQMTHSSGGWEQIFSNMLPLEALPTPVSGGLLHRELLPLQDLMWVLLILLHSGKPWNCRLSLLLLTVSTQTHHRSHNASVLQTQWNDTDRLPPHTGKWWREYISPFCFCFKQWPDDKRCALYQIQGP